MEWLVLLLDFRNMNTNQQRYKKTNPKRKKWKKENNNYIQSICSIVLMKNSRALSMVNFDMDGTANAQLLSTLSQK